VRVEYFISIMALKLNTFLYLVIRIVYFRTVFTNTTNKLSPHTIVEQTQEQFTAFILRNLWKYAKKRKKMSTRIWCGDVINNCRGAGSNSYSLSMSTIFFFISYVFF